MGGAVTAARQRAVTAARDGALLVVGDVVTDIVARHRTALAPGTDTAAAIRTVPGGAGANVACWAAHGGGAAWPGAAEVRLLGRVGANAAAWHEAALTRAGVRPRLVVDTEAPTGTVICLVDGGAGAERTFLTDSGAALRLSPADWSPELLDGVALLHLSGYLFFAEPSRAAARAALASARARGVPVSVDPASTGFLAETGAERFLSAVDGAATLLPSRGEAELLSGLSDPADAASKLCHRFPSVVVKLGAEGALVARGGEVLGRAPAEPARVRDSTGAGDAFTGAFLAARLAGAGLREAAVAGCGAGAHAVTRIGGRPPAP
ncbi:PfkB family carbohydrate kinase [Streptomyces sp. NPDC005562]|uniref:carbohydrate kinase family protein n=1 Tax=Streptomyces sp. NPDC005562 TaxID=3154890 RepID=UPI0033A76B67